MVSHGVALTLFFSIKTLKRFFEKIKIQDMMDILYQGQKVKDLISPLTLSSPRQGEERKKMKRFKQCALTLALSRRAEKENE